MIANSNNSSADTTATDDSRLNTLLNRLYKCINKSDDSLSKANELSKFLVYLSIVLAVLIPILCFAFFVHPAMSSYTSNQAQIVSIPLLKQQLARLKKTYQSSRVALMDLETKISSNILPDTESVEHYPMALHRLAHRHQLLIVATDTLNDDAIPTRFAKHFTAIRFSWRMKGSFLNYLTFKKALVEKYALIHIEREHLLPQENQQLDITIDINIYQPQKVAL